MAPVVIQISSANTFVRRIKTRMPFKFGKSTLTEMPIVHLKVELDTPIGKVTGASAFGIPPLWFDKNDQLNTEEHQQNLLYSLHVALEEYSKNKGSAWGLHERLGATVLSTCKEQGLNDLTSSFGVALLDSAIVDGVCRITKTPFHEALLKDLLGFGTHILADLPKTPPSTMAIRHTIGLADPLFTTDIEEPLKDGLPESLEEVLRDYKVRYIKIKVTSDVSASLDRLKNISKVLQGFQNTYSITLDGNEQFPSMEKFGEFITAVAKESSLDNFWKQVLWIEEPVNRKNSLLDEVKEPLQKISQFKPVIIDESGGWDGAVDRALELGYRGISAKNCKGVFRTLQSFVKLKAYEKKHNLPVTLSSEDLTNVPVLPLHQDLCVASTLGIPHSERNGHHYIRGFAFLSEQEQQQTLKAFPSLYKQVESGPPILNIAEGSVSLNEINRWGYGAPSEPDWDFMHEISLPKTPCS